MEFFIKKNATLPLLKLQVVKDGRSDYNNFMKLIEVASLYFSMVDTETGIPKFTSRPAGIVEKTFDDPNAETEYYIYYQFSSNDTKDEGRYEGQFMIRSSEGVLILPIREKLFINIQDSFIADDLNYTSCYVSDFPCCVDFPTNPICPPCPSFEPSATPTITPSLTPNLVIDLNLFSVISSGSIVVTYNLISNIPVFTNITMDFSHILETTGIPIVITTGLTLNQGSTSSILTITLDDDFNTLTTQTYFSGISVNPPQYSSSFTTNESVIFKITPTPTTTPTPTITPTNPCVQYITDELGNLIITEDGNYIVSELNPCITPTPTPSITSTLTPTPTNTETPTPTSTETPTPTPTVTPSTSAIPPVPLTLYIQPLSGGQSIIFDGVTYTSDTTVNIVKNTYYDITAVPIPGYLFTGWNIFGGEFSSTAQTTTVSVSLDSGANLAPSYGVDPNYDALEDQMTTSLSSYTSATDNDWVKITKEEYDSIFGNVDGVIKIGNNDTQIDTRETATGFQTTTFGTVDANTPLTFSAGYYVVGFIAESWNQNGQVQLGYTTTYHTGVPTYMGNSPEVIGGTRSYYVRKRPYGVEGAPATQDLYPVLNFLSPAYPNAVPNTYGWQSPDSGTTWLEINSSVQTAKIQILLTDVRSWPTPPSPTPTTTPSETPTQTPTPTNTETPTPTPTITPSQTPAAVTATTYVYNIATGCACDSIVIYSDSSIFDIGINVYSNINLTTPYINSTVYYNGQTYTISSGVVGSGAGTCPFPFCETLCTTYTNYEISNNNYNSLLVTITQNGCNEITLTVPPLTLIYVDSNTVPVTQCQRNIVVPTLWDGGTSINSNTLQLTETSETLQIQVGDTITDINLATSIVGQVSSNGTYTYVLTGPGGSVAFDCDFPLTFTGPC
jgi:hypothetical protein